MNFKLVIFIYLLLVIRSLASNIGENMVDVSAIYGLPDGVVYFSELNQEELATKVTFSGKRLIGAQLVAHPSNRERIALIANALIDILNAKEAYTYFRELEAVEFSEAISAISTGGVFHAVPFPEHHYGKRIGCFGSSEVTAMKEPISKGGRWQFIMSDGANIYFVCGRFENGICAEVMVRRCSGEDVEVLSWAAKSGNQ